MNRILVVEDETLILKALEFRLKRDGYEVIKAIDGREGLKLIETETFQLLITDMMLPFNNGLEVVNKAKELKGKAFPVIVLSNVGLENVVLEAFKLGADDYITKPFSPAELSIRVKRLIDKTST
jgi:two-component system response regulator VicR